MFSNLSQTSVGNGAEAEKQDLTLVRSILSTLGELLMALNIVGTAGKAVTRCLAMFFTICGISRGLGMSTIAAATLTG